MLLSDYSLIESIVAKLVEKVESTADLRKSIINYTNNFREFKNMKANLINNLFDYEDSFFQLSQILKTVTDSNLNYLQTFEKLKTKHFEFEKKISELESENKRLVFLGENIQNNFLSVSEFNKDKDSFIKDLIAKVNFLENILKEYQKKFYIPKYSKIFEFNNAQMVDSEKVKRLYSNMKIMEQMKMEEIEKNRVELKNELETKANVYRNYDKENQEENEDFGEKRESRKVSERPKTPANFRVKQPQKPSTLQKANEAETPPNLASTALENKETNISPKQTSNQIQSENKNEEHENFKKIENSAAAYEILLKAFSNQNLNFHLKRKYGDDYQSKLSDLNYINENFLKQLNSEISSFNEKESFKSSNFNMHEINNCLIRSLSPKNFDFSGEYLPKKKQFSQYTKKSTDFFDSNIQYGGESQVLKSPKDFYGTIRRSSKSPLGQGKNSFSSLNMNNNNHNKNNNNNSNFNFNASSRSNFGNFENYNNFNNKNKNNNNNINNNEDFENVKERDEKVRMSNTRGFSGFNRKLNSDFFINSEITNELLRKPVKVGAGGYSGK